MRVLYSPNAPHDSIFFSPKFMFLDASSQYRPNCLWSLGQIDTI